MGVDHGDSDGDRGVRGRGVPRPSGDLISVDAVEVARVFLGACEGAYGV